jgi:hypothetical protein
MFNCTDQTGADTCGVTVKSVRWKTPPVPLGLVLRAERTWGDTGAAFECEAHVLGMFEAGSLRNRGQSQVGGGQKVFYMVQTHPQNMFVRGAAEGFLEATFKRGA